MITLADVVLRDDLDPRLGDRDDDLIQQYADIFDALPPIEINQHNELIDGWHRVRAAERAKKTAIAYVVVETKDDDDLGDKMWAANLKHGAQYSREQRQTHGLKLHERGLAAKEIADRVGVGASSVYRWTKEYREKVKQERDSDIQRLRDEGKTQQEIADELGIDRSTVARNVQDSQMGISHEEDETQPQPELELDDESEPEAGDTPAAETEPEPEDSQDPEPEPPPEPIPIPPDIIKIAQAVMGTFAEKRPDDYVARLEAFGSEWMTITDDSLSNELERELLTSAAAMCLWQELMIWYQGENASTFTDAFGKIGPVFVRGQTGQWSIVSKLRSILRRLRA